MRRDEAERLVDWVLREIRRRGYRYLTDGFIDFNKTFVGNVNESQPPMYNQTPSGIVATSTDGGSGWSYGSGYYPVYSGAGGLLAEDSIWNRHVNSNADIRGTKIREATVLERGTVELAEHYEAVSGIAVQSDDPRLSTSSAVENFTDLYDVPSSYENQWQKVPTVKYEEDGIEFKSPDYYDGGKIPWGYDGHTEVVRGRNIADGGSITQRFSLDGGIVGNPDEFIQYLNNLGGEVTLSGVGGTGITVSGQYILISGVQDFLNLDDTPSSYVSHGGKFVKVNDGEDALEFSEVSNSGTETFSGDGSTTAFSFAHGLVTTPTHVEISPTSDDAAENWKWSADTNNITITFMSAPPEGTDNVTFSWRAWA